MPKAKYRSELDGNFITVRRSTDGKTIIFIVGQFGVSSRREAIKEAKSLPDHTWG